MIPTATNDKKTSTNDKKSGLSDMGLSDLGAVCALAVMAVALVTCMAATMLQIAGTPVHTQSRQAFVKSAHIDYDDAVAMLHVNFAYSKNGDGIYSNSCSMVVMQSANIQYIETILHRSFQQGNSYTVNIYDTYDDNCYAEDSVVYTRPPHLVAVAVIALFVVILTIIIIVKPDVNADC